MGETTLIIVPGWGGSHETWASFVVYAKPLFKEVIVIDLPCFGDEPCPTTVWGVSEYAEFLTKKIQSLACSKTIVLSHSFGGAVTAHALAYKGLDIDKVVFMAPAIVRKKKTFKRLVYGFFAKTGKAIFSLPLLRHGYTKARRVLYAAADAGDYTKTDGMAQQIFRTITRQDQCAALGHITIPALVIWGTQDTMTPYTDTRQIMPSLPQACLVSIEGGKHGLHHTHATRVLDALVSFSV